MTAAVFFGCTFIAFGPAIALFLFTIAREPLRVIFLILGEGDTHTHTHSSSKITQESCQKMTACSLWNHTKNALIFIVFKLDCSKLYITTVCQILNICVLQLHIFL
uniref:Gamma-secretase subunit APH-1 n=1 Tax=Nothobranchius furzeri TaxID=105023 RepID=A0A8C6KQR5_NOTFU